MIVFGTEEKELAAEPYRAMCRALAEAFGARVAALAPDTVGRDGTKEAAGSDAAQATSGAMAGSGAYGGADRGGNQTVGREFAGDGSRIESPPRRAVDGPVHVVAYQHRYGVDFSVHATLEGAYEATMVTVRRQCLRDERIRERVEAHFGHWVIDRMSYDEQDELVTRWDRFAEGEAIWISTCDIETDPRIRSSGSVPLVVDGQAIEGSVGSQVGADSTPCVAKDVEGSGASITSASRSVGGPSSRADPTTKKRGCGTGSARTGEPATTRGTRMGAESRSEHPVPPAEHGVDRPPRSDEAAVRRVKR
jgi:hypothetical protein